jgi:hypothetical protein
MEQRFERTVTGLLILRYTVSSFPAEFPGYLLEPGCPHERQPSPESGRVRKGKASVSYIKSSIKSQFAKTPERQHKCQLCSESKRGVRLLEECKPDGVRVGLTSHMPTSTIPRTETGSHFYRFQEREPWRKWKGFARR